MPDVNIMDEGNSQKIGPGFSSHKNTEHPQGRQDISCFSVERKRAKQQEMHDRLTAEYGALTLISRLFLIDRQKEDEVQK